MPRERSQRVSQAIVPNPISTASRPNASQRSRLGPRHPGVSAQPRAQPRAPPRPYHHNNPPLNPVVPTLPNIPESGNPFQFPVNLRPFLTNYHKGPFIISELDKP